MTLVDSLIALAALLGVTVVAGFLMRANQSRARRHIHHEIVRPESVGADGLGEFATLLQFSTELCARCPGVHRTLSSVADTRPGVRHLDVDLTNRPDLAKKFHVLQTPTTLILDRHGVVQTRFGGVPRRDVVEMEIARLLGVDVAHAGTNREPKPETEPERV